MPGLWIKLVKPLTVAALVGLIAAHFLAPLTAATLGVAVLWVLTMWQL